MQVDLLRSDERVPPDFEPAAEGSATPHGSDAAVPEPEPEPNEEDEASRATGGEELEPRDAHGDAHERDPVELSRELFALLFASPGPLTEARLAGLLGMRGKGAPAEALADLQERLEAQGVPLVLKSVAGGWRLFTRPEMGELLGRLAERRPEKISPAALETLSIIAYRQPVTKGEIEAVRGVGSGPVLRSLVDRRLVRVTGRAELPGSPLLYGTTREFLETFGLDTLADLPRDGELTRE